MAQNNQNSLLNGLKNTLMVGMLCVASCVQAAAPVTRPQGPLDIEADRVSSDLKKKTHHFQGHVRLKQADFEVKAAQLSIEGITGSQRVSATGGNNGRVEVMWPTEHLKAMASRVEYEQKTGEIFLSGNVYLDQNGNVLQSEKIRYVLGSRTATAEGAPANASGRVRMRWQEEGVK